MTQSKAAVIRKPENRRQILAFMDCGLTTMMDHGPQTVILIVPLINLRYSFFFLLVLMILLFLFSSIIYLVLMILLLVHLSTEKLINRYI